MTPLSLSSLPSAPLPAGEMTVPGAGAGPEFAQVLEGMAQISAVPATLPAIGGQAEPDLPAPEPAPPALQLVPPAASASRAVREGIALRRLPDGGRTLPPGLPEVPLAEPAAASTAPQGQAPKAGHTAAIAEPAHLPEATVIDAASLIATQPAVAPAPQDAAVQQEAPLQPQLLLPIVLIPPFAPQAATMPAAPPLQPGSQPQMPAAPVSYELAQLQRPEVAKAALGLPLGPAPLIPPTSLPTAFLPPAPPVPGQVQVQVQVPEPAEIPTAQSIAHQRQVLIAGRLKDDVPRPLPGLPEAVAPAFAPVIEAAPGSAFAVPRSPHEALTARPHDFSALVERITAAREAVGAQAVSIALPHAEFGQIALRFRHDEAGLSVTMASPDPGFARAVSQALPAAGTSEQPPAHPNSQQGAAAERGSGQGETSPQGRHTPPERRDERTAQRGPAPDQSRDAAARPRHRGIFA